MLDCTVVLAYHFSATTTTKNVCGVLDQSLTNNNDAQFGYGK